MRLFELRCLVSAWQQLRHYERQAARNVQNVRKRALRKISSAEQVLPIMVGRVIWSPVKAYLGTVHTKRYNNDNTRPGRLRLGE